MFQIGERIMYGSSGVCRVEAIGKPDSAFFADRDRDYYTLSPLYGEGVIYVPVDSSVFMRPILSREEALELIRHIPEIPAEPFATRDQRLLSEHYRSFFSRHDCGDLLELIRSIYVKGQTLSRQGKRLVPPTSSTCAGLWICSTVSWRRRWTFRWNRWRTLSPGKSAVKSMKKMKKNKKTTRKGGFSAVSGRFSRHFPSTAEGFHGGKAVVAEKGQGFFVDDLAGDGNGNGWGTGDCRRGADAAQSLLRRKGFVGSEKSLPDGAGGFRHSRRQKGLFPVGKAVFPQGVVDFAEILRRIFRRGHEHHILRVGVLALHGVLAEFFRQLKAGKAVRGLNGQA